MHLIIDGYGGDGEKMRSTEEVYHILETLPARVGMTKITEPKVVIYRGPVPEDWGISGFVLIAESHISIHTFPDRDFVQMDVFSCKEFNTEAALKEICRAFSFQAVKTWVIQRGLEYYDPHTARQVASRRPVPIEGAWR
jgi:S-adenosylmethionine decarboxylase